MLKRNLHDEAWKQIRKRSAFWGYAWWYMQVIPAAQEVEAGGSNSEASPAKTQDPI
jgi:hypothetical protein